MKKQENKFSTEELNNEVWKDIEGYEGLYKISNLGRVYSVKRKKVKQLSVNDKRGYIGVWLFKDGKRTHISVHRLVGIHFVEGRTDTKCLLNHKDENKHNNRAENLEWCTPVYNRNYSLDRRKAESAQLKRLLNDKEFFENQILDEKLNKLYRDFSYEMYETICDAIAKER